MRHPDCVCMLAAAQIMLLLRRKRPAVQGTPQRPFDTSTACAGGRWEGSGKSRRMREELAFAGRLLNVVVWLFCCSLKNKSFTWQDVDTPCTSTVVSAAASVGLARYSDTYVQRHGHRHKLPCRKWLVTPLTRHPGDLP